MITVWKAAAAAQGVAEQGGETGSFAVGQPGKESPALPALHFPTGETGFNYRLLSF